MVFIYEDVFDIAKRLKEVDETYKLFYNGKTGKFELYGGRELSKILIFPYDAIDERMVEHARKTRVERLNLIIEEIEKHNEELEIAGRKEQINRAVDLTKEVVKMVRYD